MTRRGPRWRSEGSDPDYRYSLANERTFLAWVRTSLALLAGGVAVAQLLPPFAVAGARTALAAVLALLGLAVSALAYARWAANERAMRNGSPLPHTQVFVLLAAGLTLVAVVVLVLVVAGGE